MKYFAAALCAIAFGLCGFAFAAPPATGPQSQVDPHKLPHRQADPRELKYEPIESLDRARQPEAPKLLEEEEEEETRAAEQALYAEIAQSAPSAADLAETEDVRFTAGLHELAQTFGGNPKKILKWVKRNVAFTPTFGSIQGSEGCRLSRECNAHDTASLLIALLRASNIPARYATGQALLDPDFFRSASGDFDDVVAAGLFVVNSGTPATFFTNNVGDVVAVRLQHVWVEAYVAKGGIEQWVTLDAALKRNEFKPPRDLDIALGLDAGVFESILNSATLDAEGNSISDIDADAIGQEVNGLQDAFDGFVARRPPQSTLVKLTGALKPQIVATGLSPEPGPNFQVEEQLSELPPESRHQLTFTLSNADGSEAINVTRSLPSLADRRLSLGYLPATQADLDLVNSFGGLYQAPPNQLMLSPTLFVEGEPIAAGPAIRMGTLQQVRIFFSEPDGASDFVEHFVSAGSYAVVGLNLQRVGSEALNSRRARIASTIDEARANLSVNLDDVLGEILHSQTQIYYALLDAHTRLSANQRNVVYSRRPSEMLMTFSPVFTFDSTGVPIETRHGAMTMDFRRSVLGFGSRTGNRNDASAFFFGVGAFSSALEHAIFETAQDTASISTMRLLTEANEQAIPIFAIDSDNVATALPQLNLPEVIEEEIEQSVAAGNFIVVHRDVVQYLLYTGVGMIIVDPDSGAGGYLIFGGIFGGFSAEESENLQQTESGTINAVPFSLESNEQTGLFEPRISGGGGSANAATMEGLLLGISTELNITENDIAVVENSSRQVGSLSECARERFANAQSGALMNGVLWDDLFGAFGGIPTDRTHVPSLSAFVFDKLARRLTLSREQGAVCL